MDTAPDITRPAPPETFSGRAFYDPRRDAVAYLVSGLACAALVAYVSMLAAWAAAWSEA